MDRDTTNNFIAEAMSAYVRKNYDECITRFTEVLAIDPQHQLSLMGRGSAFLQIHQTAKAEADFDRVISLNPRYARAYHLRGLAREKHGDDDAAVEDFDQAILLDPQYGAAYASRAALLDKRGQVDKAVEDIKMIGRLTQMNVETFANANNIWQTHHMRVEDAMETELNR